MTPMPAVLMNTPSPLPLSTTLVSPVMICTPQRLRRVAHRADNLPERFHRQAFLDDERALR